jgi:hypothetical protein
MRYLNFLFRFLCLVIGISLLALLAFKVAIDLTREILWLQEVFLKIDFSYTIWLAIYLWFSLNLIGIWSALIRFVKLKKVTDKYTIFILSFFYIPTFLIILLAAVAYICRGTIWFQGVISKGGYNQPKFIFQSVFTLLLMIGIGIWLKRRK